MYMNMEDPFPRRAAIVDCLHGLRDRIAADPRADRRIIDVFIVGNRMIPIKKDEPALTGQRSHAAKNKADPFRGERVRPGQVPEDFSMQPSCEPDLDFHFSFVKPVRWATRICASVGNGRLTIHENANQFLSQIRALLMFQFRVYDDLICTEKYSRDG
jgi:hypothetical protein